MDYSEATILVFCRNSCWKFSEFWNSNIFGLWTFLDFVFFWSSICIQLLHSEEWIIVSLPFWNFAKIVFGKPKFWNQPVFWTCPILNFVKALWRYFRKIGNSEKFLSLKKFKVQKVPTLNSGWTRLFFEPTRFGILKKTLWQFIRNF